MTTQELYRRLRQELKRLVDAHRLNERPIELKSRGLSPEEAIGHTLRKDSPILAGKEIMLQARFGDALGQAFTDAPSEFCGTLDDVLSFDTENDPHGRALLIATLNAVMRHTGDIDHTLHCKNDDLERCAEAFAAYVRENFGSPRIALVGYQPALLEMLAGSGRQARVLDLNPENVGATRFGTLVEDGARAKEDLVQWADLILCTGSTLCNGTIVDYMELPVPVVFFGITLAGSAELLGLRRVCFADRHE